MTFEIAVIVASLAGCSFILSIFSLYWNSLRIVHNILAVYDYQRPSAEGRVISDYSSNFEIKIILLNQGNRSETIMSASLFYENQVGQFRSGGPASFVLEAGDAQIITLSHPMHTVVSNALTGGGKTMPFGFKVDLIEPSGLIVDRRIELGTIYAVQAAPGDSAHLRVEVSAKPGATTLLKTDWRRRFARVLKWT